MVRSVDPVTPTRIGETVGADGNRVLALDPFPIRYGSAIHHRRRCALCDEGFQQGRLGCQIESAHFVSNLERRKALFSFQPFFVADGVIGSR
jgi:hypothetical protein